MEGTLKFQLDGTDALIRELRGTRADLRRFSDDLREWSSTFCTAVATIEELLHGGEETAAPVIETAAQEAAPAPVAPPEPPAPAYTPPATMPTTATAPVTPPAAALAPTAAPPPPAPAPAPVPATATIPTAPPPAPAPTTIPTAPITYTREQLKKAAAEYIGGHKDDMPKFREILANLGYNSLTILPENLFPAFAAQFRAMGGKI